MRVIGAIVLILGVAAIVLGVVFIVQANAGQQEIVDQIAPLQISEVDNRYDQVDMKVSSMEQTDPTYTSYFSQRTSLGLTRSNIGNVKAVRMNGILDIGIGAGLVLTGAALFLKAGN